MTSTSPTSFRDLTLGAFVDELASSAPVPGGGSASAVAASLGAALVAMVASLSEGRPKYASHADSPRASDEPSASDWRDGSSTWPTRTPRLRGVRRGDEAAAGHGRGAVDPHGGPERRRRAPREVPLATVEACLELVATAESLVGRSNVNASSDLDVATLLGEAAAAARRRTS